MRLLAAVMAAAALVAAPAAAAASATPAEVRELARRAASDPAALAQLRRIDRVDGAPVDLRAALSGARGTELERRLAALAAGGERAAAAPAAARADAAAVLAERRFSETSPPRPFRRLLGWLGDRIDGPVTWLGRPLSWLAARIPGGEAVLWVILGGLVMAGAAFVAARLGASRGGGVVDRTARLGGEPAADPRKLERLADEAEGRGDLDLALRLRFRAGLLRLARIEAIPEPETLTSRQLVRLLGSEQFGRLARDLDEVVYGGRAASRADVESARTGWPQVLARAGRS
jgi:hypothetical protein